MSSKTLSNGTLGLRFMQNSQRAKKVAEVEAEQAKVVDEAEWHVSPELRKTWDIDSQPGPSQTAIYEASYLPFIFDAESSKTASSSSMKGRRLFNKDGKEVATEAIVQASPNSDDENPAIQDWSKGSQRPVSISGSSLRVDVSPKGKKRAKAAATVLSETVRKEPRGAPSGSWPAPSPRLALGNAFAKPVGVDAPVIGVRLPQNSSKQKDVSPEDFAIVPGARAQTKPDKKRAAQDTGATDSSSRRKKSKHGQ